MTASDLKEYQPHVRRPVRGQYRGHEIVSMPPSSSGGVVLIQMLNILEGYKLADLDEPSRAAPDDRGDAPRLCRPRRLSRRSRRGERAVVAADVQALRSDAAQQHQSWTRDAVARDPCRHRVATRRGEHHAFLRSGSPRQRRIQHLYAQFQFRRRDDRRRHRRAAQQRARRLCRQAAMCQMPLASSAATPMRPAPASGRCRR